MKKIELFFAANNQFSYVVINGSEARVQQLPNGRVMGMIEERFENQSFEQIGIWQDKEGNATEFVVGFVKR